MADETPTTPAPKKPKKPPQRRRYQAENLILEQRIDVAVSLLEQALQEAALDHDGAAAVSKRLMGIALQKLKGE